MILYSINLCQSELYNIHIHTLQPEAFFLFAVFVIFQANTMVKYTLDGESLPNNNSDFNLSNLGDLKVPEAWIPVGKVKKLFIYPVKSCKGLSVDSFLTGKHAAENEELVDR